MGWAGLGAKLGPASPLQWPLLPPLLRKEQDDTAAPLVAASAPETLSPKEESEQVVCDQRWLDSGGGHARTHSLCSGPVQASSAQGPSTGAGTLPARVHLAFGGRKTGRTKCPLQHPGWGEAGEGVHRTLMTLADPLCKQLLPAEVSTRQPGEVGLGGGGSGLSRRPREQQEDCLKTAEPRVTLKTAVPRPGLTPRRCIWSDLARASARHALFSGWTLTSLLPQLPWGVKQTLLGRGLGCPLISPDRYPPSELWALSLTASSPPKAAAQGGEGTVSGTAPLPPNSGPSENLRM